MSRPLSERHDVAKFASLAALLVGFHRAAQQTYAATGDEAGGFVFLPVSSIVGQSDLILWLFTGVRSLLLQTQHTDWTTITPVRDLRLF